MIREVISETVGGVEDAALHTIFPPRCGREPLLRHPLKLIPDHHRYNEYHHQQLDHCARDVDTT